MKRSVFTVVAASVVALGACGGGDTNADIEPVEEVQPAPPPAPAPMVTDTTMMMDTTMVGDTLPGDTIPAQQ